MKRRILRIGEMRIQVPGTSATDGRRLGQTVAQRLADSTSSFNSRTGRIRSLTVRVKPQQAKSADQLTDVIVASIRRE